MGTEWEVSPKMEVLQVFSYLESMQVASVFSLQKSSFNRNNGKYMFSTRKWEKEGDRERKEEEEEGEERVLLCKFYFPIITKTILLEGIISIGWQLW